MMSDAGVFDRATGVFEGLHGRGRGARAACSASRLSAAADPDDLQRQAQDRTIAAGGKLTPEEEAKRKKHPLDRFDEISALAAAGKFPSGTDIFLTKFHGLFYVAPAQDAFMCRLRMPGGMITSHQLRGVAAIADDLAGGYADITTRANLQLREISAANAPEVLLRLAEIGLTSRGAGADNLRNVTGSPTAGHRPSGADRYAAGHPRSAPLHFVSSGTIRAAAQVQHRLRRRRPRRGARGHQRHRPRRGAGRGRLRRDRRACITGLVLEGSPDIATSRATPA